MNLFIRYKLFWSLGLLTDSDLEKFSWLLASLFESSFFIFLLICILVLLVDLEIVYLSIFNFIFLLLSYFLLPTNCNFILFLFMDVDE